MLTVERDDCIYNTLITWVGLKSWGRFNNCYGPAQLGAAFVQLILTSSVCVSIDVSDHGGGYQCVAVPYRYVQRLCSPIVRQASQAVGVGCWE